MELSVKTLGLGVGQLAPRYGTRLLLPTYLRVYKGG